MRLAVLANSPALANQATFYSSPPSFWGPMKAWLDPYLPLGPEITENLYGNLHSQCGSNTTTSPTSTSMALSNLGNTFTGNRVVVIGTVSGATLSISSIVEGQQSDIHIGMSLLYAVWQANGTQTTAIITGGSYPTYNLSSASAGNVVGASIILLDRYLSADGQPAFQLMDDPDDPAGYRKCWQYRQTFADYRPSGQAETSPGLRKCLVRFGDNAAEPSEGQGCTQPTGTYYMDLMAIRVPLASYQQSRYRDANLVYQHKNSTGAPGLSVNITAGQYRDEGLQLIANGTLLPLVDPHQPRITIQVYGQNGANPKGAQSDNVILANYPADTWIYLLFRVKPNLNSTDNPHTQVWVAAGSANCTLAVDHHWGNADVNGTPVNRQWGWYLDNTNVIVQGTGVNDWPHQHDWWGTGDEVLIQHKGPFVAPQWRADMEPPLWLVDQWFNQMRGR